MVWRVHWNNIIIILALYYTLLLLLLFDSDGVSVEELSDADDRCRSRCDEIDTRFCSSRTNSPLGYWSRGLWLPHWVTWPLNDEDLLDRFDPFPDAVDEFEDNDWFVGEPVTVVIVGRLGRVAEDLGDSVWGELARPRGLLGRGLLSAMGIVSGVDFCRKVLGTSCASGS